MTRLPLLAALAFAATAATLTQARDDPPAAEAASFAPIGGIEWSYAARARDEDGDAYLRFVREGMNSTMGVSDLPELGDALESVSQARAGDAVSFALRREAGVLACEGRASERGRAAGSCRFDPDGEFVRQLIAHQLEPEDVEQLLALAFVDARMATVDGFSRNGLPLRDVDELMGISALEVTPAYADELREAGLQVSDVEDLVAAKALEVDAAWLAEMAEAGYANLDLEKAIELRALGVTPDYARRMARVMRALDGAE